MAHRNRTPEQQATEFLDANKRWAVVAGSAILHAKKKRADGSPVSTGVRYKLENNRWYHLGSVAAGLLPEGFPRWMETE